MGIWNSEIGVARRLRVRAPRMPLAGAAVWIALFLVACGGGEESPEMEAILELDRGARLLEDGHFEQAYRVFDSVVRKEPRNAEAYARRGFAQLALGGVSSGLADINKALEIDTEYALAHNYKGVVFAMNGIEDQAILEFTRAVELAPGPYGRLRESREGVSPNVGRGVRAGGPGHGVDPGTGEFGTTADPRPGTPDSRRREQGGGGPGAGTVAAS